MLIRPRFQLQQAATSRSAASSRRSRQLAVERGGALEIESELNKVIKYVSLLSSTKKEAALCSRVILSVWINMQHPSPQLRLKGHFFARKKSWVVTCNRVQHKLKKQTFSILNNGSFSWRPFCWYTVARRKSHPLCYYVTAGSFNYSEDCWTRIINANSTKSKSRDATYPRVSVLSFCYVLTLLWASEGLTVEHKDVFVPFVLCFADKCTLIHHDKPCDLW